MILWLMITKDEQDALRLYQQLNYPGAPWSPPIEVPPYVKPVEEEVSNEVVKEMSSKPHTVAEARR
jgi:hypothetical protein